MNYIFIILLISLLFTYKSVGGGSFLFVLNLIPNKITQIWRLFTYTFVHVSWSHFFSNLLFFCIGFLGFFQQMSNFQFISFYLVCSIISTLPFILLNFSKPTQSLSGLSGMVFSVIYGFITLNPFQIINFYFFDCPVWIIGCVHMSLEIIGSLSRKNVSLITHIAGAIVGSLFVTLFLK